MRGERMRVMLKGGYVNAWVQLLQKFLDLYGAVAGVAVEEYWPDEVAVAERNHTENVVSQGIAAGQANPSSRVNLDGVEQEIVQVEIAAAAAEILCEEMEKNHVSKNTNLLCKTVDNDVADVDQGDFVVGGFRGCQNGDE